MHSKFLQLPALNWKKENEDVVKLLVADSLLISCGLVCKVSLLKCLLEYYTICLARIGIGIGLGV